jgi:hypothetical protein
MVRACRVFLIGNGGCLRSSPPRVIGDVSVAMWVVVA